jgi:hypothetical protein
VSSQASLYIPLTTPSSLPSYITLDPYSPWHTSALLSTAMETMTLPSRLRARDGKRESLAEIAAALNVNGNQNIAKLGMSIAADAPPNGDSRESRAGRLDALPETRDARLPSHNGRLSAEDDGEGGVEAMDVDFFPPDVPAQGVRGRRTERRVHTFGSVESVRSDHDARDVDDDDDGDALDGRERARRRAAGLPILYKYESPLSSLSPSPSLPLPFSFPPTCTPPTSTTNTPTNPPTERQPPFPTPSSPPSPTSTRAPPPR